MKVDLVAKKAFNYGSNRLEPGDIFEATRQHARLLVALGNASNPPKAKAKAKAPAPVDPNVDSSADTSADSSDAPESDLSVDTTVEPQADLEKVESKKRRLSRRDMGADT